MEFDFLEELYVFNSKSKYVPREMYEQQKALADKRLELLKEGHDRCKNKGWCPFCTMLEVDTFLGHEHAPDCELAEAIDERTKRDKA